MSVWLVALLAWLLGVPAAVVFVAATAAYLRSRDHPPRQAHVIPFPGTRAARPAGRSVSAGRHG